jgi:hypothetical protein
MCLLLPGSRVDSSDDPVREGRDLPLDFISWHHYGNTPFLGPDGSEPLGPPEVVAALEPLHQRNPSTSPSHYADQVAAVRSWRDALYGDAAKPELWIDEWNLSAGGFDLRHDGTAGAAFQAGVLVELQRSDLDRASVFRSVDPAYGPDVVPAEPELYGGWGLVGRKGTVKPAWWAHRFWRDLGSDVLTFTSSDDSRLGVSGVLTRADAKHFVALVSNFQASGEHAHALELRLEGAGSHEWSVSARSPDGTEDRSTISSQGTLVVPVDLGAQSVVLVDIEQVSPTPTPTPTPPVSRPDGLIGLGDGELVGDNIYNTTGAGQTIQTTARRGQTRAFTIQISNDGGSQERFAVDGPPVSKAFTERYFEGSSDVTEQVVAGTYTTRTLAPGESADLTLEIKPTGRAKPGSIRSAAIVVASRTDPAALDTVKAEVKVKAGPRRR